jgi:hypothetical protein
MLVIKAAICLPDIKGLSRAEGDAIDGNTAGL